MVKGKEKLEGRHYFLRYSRTRISPNCEGQNIATHGKERGGGGRGGHVLWAARRKEKHTRVLSNSAGGQKSKAQHIFIVSKGEHFHEAIGRKRKSARWWKERGRKPYRSARKMGEGGSEVLEVVGEREPREIARADTRETAHKFRESIGREEREWAPPTLLNGRGIQKMP